MSNFEMFNDEWSLFAILGKQAEENIYHDPNVTLIKVRQFAEKMIEALFSLEDMEFQDKDTQLDRLRKLEYYGVIEDEISSVFHNIRKLGNKAAHDNYGNTSEAMIVVKYAHYLSNWFMEVYGSLDYVPIKFIEPKDVNKSKTDEIKKLKEQLEIAENEKKIFKVQLEEAVKQVDKWSDEIKKKRRERSKAFLRNIDLDEKQTRLMFIDEQLRSAGWEADTENLVWKKGTRPQKGRNIAISEVPTENGRADYALFIGLDLVGVVEAKRYSKAIAGDISQAKEYSREVKESSEFNILNNYGKYKVPFIYVTNGRSYLKQFKEQSGVWFWDARIPKKSSFVLETWHSPKDLEQKLIVDEAKAEKKLEEEPYPKFASRHYQIEAVKAVEKAMSKNKRRMLLAMATGTGKTRLALSLMYRLIKTKRVRRILFLVDRNSLGRQAADALKDTKIENISFSDIYDVKGVTDILPDKDTKIHIATVQGMVRRLFFKDKSEEALSVGTYDFIIVDEAHRGYIEDREMSEDEFYYQNEEDYISKYCRVINYFDATVLALTATPALHTTKIFGTPIYTYSYTDAVVDGYLVDHEPPYRFETELLKTGIKFEKDTDVEIWNKKTKSIDKVHLKDDVDFDVESFNKQVITENFNKVILEELTKYIDLSKLGKTLIFAANDEHADMVVRLLKQAYQDSGELIEDDAIEKITGYIRHPDKEIKRFQNEKYPQIVVTVDLLTTGINVPEIENLVFLRRVRSRILYDQMLGRATRLCSEIGKSSFRIFDAVRLYDYLQNVTDMKPVVVNPNQTINELMDRVIYAESKQEFEFLKSEIIAKMQAKKQQISKEGKKEISELSEISDLDLWLQSLKKMSKEEFNTQTERILRIADYKQVVYGSYLSHHKDRVLDISRGYGKDNAKPKDYLSEFNQFIRENINLIPALEIVVNHPKDLTYKSLHDLQLKLKEKRFDEKSLQEAWKHEKKEFIAADIISFVRQAALGTELVDHTTRIKNAMQKIYGMEDWTPIQMKWLDRIEKQLIETPVLAPTAKQYFDEIEVWKQNGGYKIVKRNIGDKIDNVVQILNEQLYA